MGTEDQKATRIVAVDDELSNIDRIETYLKPEFDVVGAVSPEKALELLPLESRISVIIADLVMPTMSGIDFIRQAMLIHPSCKTILLVEEIDTEMLLDILDSRVVDKIIRKPKGLDDLLSAVRTLVTEYKETIVEQDDHDLLSERNLALNHHCDNLTRKLQENEEELRIANREIERVSAELEVVSYQDPLTGLYNYRVFQKRLAEEVARAQRHNHPLCLLHADIDQFARINRDLGYQIGDEILRRIATIVSGNESHDRLRDSDIVARYNGEELFILLPETSKPGGLVKANRIAEAIRDAELPGNTTITVSIGVTCYPSDAKSHTDLLHCAKKALTAAKKVGPGQVVSFVGQFETTDGPLPFTPGKSFDQGERITSVHDRIGEIISILFNERAIHCLYVDLTRLKRIEHELGAAQHATIYDRAGSLLDDMRGSKLRQNDIICRIPHDDAYVCILSPSRDSTETPLFDIETIAKRISDQINTALQTSVNDLIRDKPRITVGHSRVLSNSMIRPERLIQRMLDDARDSARLVRQKDAQKNKRSLQEIILGGSIRPVYQPIVHIDTCEIFAFEALTRGPKESALESPATLFAVADEVDLTFELDRACFRGALRGAVGLEPVHRLFVNLLPLSFYDAHFIENEVGLLLEAAGLAPSNIVFEITERLAIENFTSFRKALTRYTAMGFGVAIDDVGTRHSNLETIMALRPDFIKISDVITRGVARSRVKREMLRSLKNIASTIDALIVAEGIETADDMVVLHDLGIQFGQGYFLARPGPPFPSVKPAIRRAVKTLSKTSKKPTPAPPADYDWNMGSSNDEMAPSQEVERRVLEMADGTHEVVDLSGISEAVLMTATDSYSETSSQANGQPIWQPLDLGMQRDTDLPIESLLAQIKNVK